MNEYERQRIVAGEAQGQRRRDLQEQAEQDHVAEGYRKVHPGPLRRLARRIFHRP